MIKKIILILMIFLSFNSITAKECTIVCPTESIAIIEDEKLINKITGLNYLSKKIAEVIIEKELKEELTSKFNASLELFSIKRLKKGEFKLLTLTCKQLAYKALRMSNFYAQTVCPYNKIVYSNNKIFFPHDLAFKFKSTITNSDIEGIIKSYQFQRELKKCTFTFNGVKGFEIKTPVVKIKNGKMFFSIPVETFIFSEPFYINLSTDIEVKNNNIVLKNITFLSKNNIIKNDIFAPLINKINPLYYQINSIDTKYCKIYITNVKIEDNIISTGGIFIINQNYGKPNE